MEETRRVTFISKATLEDARVNDYPWYKGKTKFPNYEGWFNSATWCFNLYFRQESELVQMLEELRRQDRTINPREALKLFERAQNWRKMQPIDSWCEGSVLYEEIIENYLLDNP